MDQLPSLEDSRGVDVSQIRRLLRMSVEDRWAIVHYVRALQSLSK
jgi:hypothetical protein